jgi:Ca2+-binding EF-hand superfamily protein
VDELAKQALEIQFQNLDTDGGGMVSFNEIMWSVGMTGMHLEEQQRRASYTLMRGYFERADVAQREAVSYDELSSFFHWEAEDDNREVQDEMLKMWGDLNVLPEVHVEMHRFMVIASMADLYDAELQAQTRADELEKAEEQFAEADLDSSGTISREEQLTLFLDRKLDEGADINDPETQKWMEAQMDSLDEDGDGEVTRKEFLTHCGFEKEFKDEMFLKKREDFYTKVVRPWFDKTDTDNDNAISWQQQLLLFKRVTLNPSPDFARLAVFMNKKLHELVIARELKEKHSHSSAVVVTNKNKKSKGGGMGEQKKKGNQEEENVELITAEEFFVSVAMDNLWRTDERRKKRLVKYRMLRTRFEDVDADNSGHITFDEQTKLFGDSGFDMSDPATRAFMEEQFAQMDTDGDGMVSLEEFMAMAGLSDLWEEIDGNMMVALRRQAFLRLRYQFRRHAEKAETDGVARKQLVHVFEDSEIDTHSPLMVEFEENMRFDRQSWTDQMAIEDCMALAELTDMWEENKHDHEDEAAGHVISDEDREKMQAAARRMSVLKRNGPSFNTLFASEALAPETVKIFLPDGSQVKLDIVAGEEAKVHATEEEMKVMALDKQYHSLIDQFREADSDRSGEITREEQEALFHKQGVDVDEPEVKAYLDKMWTQLDADGSGGCHLGEFMAAAGFEERWEKEHGREEREAQKERDEQYEGLVQQFKDADADGDGQISREEQEQVFIAQGIDLEDEKTKAYIDKQWAKLDKDGSGGVAIDEFMVAAGWGERFQVEYEKEREQRYQELIAQFQRADYDGDGEITRQEQEDSFAAQGINVEDPNIKASLDRQWAMLDKDGSGAVNLKEFLMNAGFGDRWKKIAAEQRADKKDEQYAGLMAQFKSVDADGNGEITREEQEALFTKQGVDIEDEKVKAAMDKMWTQLDADGSGGCHLGEFMAAAGFGERWEKEEKASNDKAAKNKRYEGLIQQFKDADADGDGQISREEQEQVFIAQGVDLEDEKTKAYIDKQWAKLDKDGSGGVAIDEFMVAAGFGQRWTMEREKRAREEREAAVEADRQYKALLQQFAKADGDGNGTISRAEQEQMFRAEGIDITKPKFKNAMDAQWLKLDHDGSGGADLKEFMEVAGFGVRFAREHAKKEVAQKEQQFANAMFGGGDED